MRRPLLFTVAAIAAAGLAAGAVPAFTADTGSVTVTITAEPAAQPCITVGPSTMDFGTLPFSTAGALSSRFIPPLGGTPTTVTSCGTAGQHLTLTGSDATGTTGSWTISGDARGTNQCPAVNRFNLTGHRELDANQGIHLSTSPRLVLAPGGVGPYVLGAGGSDNFGFTIDMPCQGSNGAGEQKSMTVTFTATNA
jgi:hypothetical protein